MIEYMMPDEHVVAEGGQAVVSRWVGADGKSWLRKRYKADNPIARFSAQDEWYKLTLLAAHRNKFEGWVVGSPEVAPLKYSPLELVEQWFEGEQLLTLWRSDNYSNMPQLIDAVSQWLMDIWFSQALQIGDFRFTNLLVNTEKKELCLVDVGLPAPEYSALHVAGGYTPASRDLGYLFYTMASERYSLSQKRWSAAHETLGQAILERIVPLIKQEHPEILEKIAPVAHFFIDRMKNGHGPIHKVFWRRYMAFRSSRRAKKLLKMWGLTADDTRSMYG